MKYSLVKHLDDEQWDRLGDLEKRDYAVQQFVDEFLRDVPIQRITGPVRFEILLEEVQP